MKNLVEKLKMAIPHFLLTVLTISIGFSIYGISKLLYKYSPVMITSGSQVVFRQNCIETAKDKDGKDFCKRQGPLTIFSVHDVQRDK